MIVNCNMYKDLFAYRGEVNRDLFQKRDILSRVVGKIARILHLPFLNNLNDLSNPDDTIIIFDDCVKEKRINWLIANKYKEKRLVFYYWNPVSESINPKLLPPTFEKWSYSLTDCKKYGMNYNPTFSFKELFDNTLLSPTNISKYDVVFIGKDKGRKRPLNVIRKKLFEKGFKCFFYITPNHPKICLKHELKGLKYSEVLEITNQSKAILDFYKNPDTGFSLRVVEAVFLDKTLLTNNTEALSFFGENKGVVDISCISASNFCNLTKAHFEEKTKEFFDYSSWIKRFET